MCGYMRMDRIRNDVIRDIVKMAPIEDKMRETRIRRFAHEKRRSVDAPVKRCEMINIPEGKRGRRRPLKCLNEVIRQVLKLLELTEDIAQDRRPWRDRIKVLDHREMASSISFSCLIDVIRLQ